MSRVRLEGVVKSETPCAVEDNTCKGDERLNAMWENACKTGICSVTTIPTIATMAGKDVTSDRRLLGDDGASGAHEAQQHELLCILLLLLRSSSAIMGITSNSVRSVAESGLVEEFQR